MKIHNKSLSLYITLLAVFTITLFQACVDTIHEDDQIDIINNYPQKITVTTVYGTILDIDNDPLVNATVELTNTTTGSQTTVSDDDGFYAFYDVEVGGQLANFIVSHSGNFDLYRNITVSTNQIHTAHFIFADRISSGNFSSHSGGKIELENDVAISFDPNSISQEDGESYTGEVNVFVNYYEPNDDQSKSFGGNFGRDAIGDNVAVASYGSLQVELESTSGSKLNLSAGRLAKIQIPMRVNAKDVNNLKLAHYDETNQQWQEQGIGKVENNFYVGEVAHFSTWTLCNLFDNVHTLNGQINLKDEGVIIETQVFYKFDYSIISIFMHNNTGGLFSCPLVIADEPFIFSIENICGEVIYSQNMEALTDDKDFGIIDIEVDPVTYSTLTAQILNCDGSNAHDVYARFRMDHGGFVTKFQIMRADQGIINFNFPICQQEVFGSLFLLNESNLLTTERIEVNLNNGDVNLNQIHLCDTFPFFLKIELDGSQFLHAFIIDNVIVNSQDEGYGATRQDFNYCQFITHGRFGGIRTLDLYNSRIGTGDGSVKYINSSASGTSLNAIITEYIPPANGPDKVFYYPELIVGTIEGTVDQVDPDTYAFIKKVSLTGSFRIGR